MSSVPKPSSPSNFHRTAILNMEEDEDEACDESQVLFWESSILMWERRILRWIWRLVHQRYGSELMIQQVSWFIWSLIHRRDLLAYHHWSVIIPHRKMIYQEIEDWKWVVGNSVWVIHHWDESLKKYGSEIIFHWAAERREIFIMEEIYLWSVIIPHKKISCWVTRAFQFFHWSLPYLILARKKFENGHAGWINSQTWINIHVLHHP